MLRIDASGIASDSQTVVNDGPTGRDVELPLVPGTTHKPVLRGWCAYFHHGVSSKTFSYLDAYTWRRVICWLRRKHPRANWRWLRGRYLPGWRPTGTRLALYDPSSVRIVRYRYRGTRIANPWQTSAVAA